MDSTPSTLGSGCRRVVRGGDRANVTAATFLDYAPAVEWRLLESVPEEEARRFLALARRRTFARNEVVFHHGDPADTIHLVRKGRFAARVTTPRLDTVTIVVHGPGEAFGELALVNEAPRSATIVALEAAETLSIYKTEFARLRREHPLVDDVLISLLAERIRRDNELLMDALWVDADRRVLRRLRELATMYSGSDGAEGIVIPLTQEDIAGLAGTSRATVNRVLRDQEKRGTVELRRGKTVVVDVDELARRAR